MSDTLAVRADQTQWTAEQLAVLRQMGADRASAADLRMFLYRCQTLGLDPFAHQIWLVEYGGRPTIQVGIAGLESIARSVCDARGIDMSWSPDLWCGPDGQWRDVWTGEGPPHAAKATLHRGAATFTAVALYAENVALTKSGQPNGMWRQRPAGMVAKCARAQALRAAFPVQMSGTYVPEEMPGRMVRSDVVPETPPDIGHWLGLVRAASTREELLAIWSQAEPLLSVPDRARLRVACADAAAALDQAARDQAALDQADDADDPLPYLDGWTDTTTEVPGAYITVEEVTR